MGIPFRQPPPFGETSLQRWICAAIAVELPPPGVAQAGIGVLLGRQICVPVASTPPGLAVPTSLPAAVQWVVQGLQRQPVAPRQLAAQPAALPVRGIAALSVPQPGSLATHPAVLDALQAQAAGSALSRETIQNYVALGERVVRAIQQSCAAGDQRLQAATQEEGVVTCSQETARAIAWYVVACAVRQDVNPQAMGVSRMVDDEGVTGLPTSEAYVFKDPNHAVYHFMQGCPLAFPRVSTHFNGLSVSPINFFGQPEQRGIADRGRRLPGENGAMLFDKLQDATGQALLFIKFESAGVPDMFTSAPRAHDMESGSASAYGAMLRVFGHSLSYVWTRLANLPAAEREAPVDRAASIHSCRRS